MLLNRIEKDNDFNTFIEFLKNNPNFNELYVIFTILNEGLDYIHEQFIEENKVLFKNCILNYINSLGETEVNNSSQNPFIQLVKKFLDKISKNNDIKISNGENDSNNYNVELEDEITFNYALSLINCNTFDKRLQGVKNLNDILFKNHNKEDNLKKMAELIKQKNIINEIFGPNYHSQIISRTSEIIRIKK